MTDKTQKPRLIIDTDIGTDCDDAFALAYTIEAMKRGEIDVKAITTVNEKDQIRAKIVRKLERILGVDIPIFAGTEQKQESHIKDGKQIDYYCGFEHLALTEQEIREPLKPYPSIEYEKDDILVGIGPLTNIALQLDENPSLRNIQEIYLMGSHEKSHNFIVDLNATEKVFSEKWKKYLITKDVSKNISLSREDIESLRVNELGNFLADSATRWLDFTNRSQSIMYDALTLSAAMKENYVSFFGNHTSAVSDYVNPELKNSIMETLKNAS